MPADILRMMVIKLLNKKLLQSWDLNPHFRTQNHYVKSVTWRQKLKKLDN